MYMNPFMNDRKMLIFNKHLSKLGASLVAERGKRLPPVLDSWVQSLGQEDLLEREMATHSSTPA